MSLIPIWNICSVFCTQLVLKAQEWVTRKHRISCFSFEYKNTGRKQILFPYFSFLTREGSNSVFSVLGFFSNYRVEPPTASLSWDVARWFLLKAILDHQETHDLLTYGHDLLDENAQIKSVISDGKEEYFYYVLFWYRWGTEPQQNKRSTTTFLIKKPVGAIPLKLTTFSSGSVCTASTPHPNDVSFKSLSRKAASAIETAVYIKLYMQKCTSDWQMWSQEHLQISVSYFGEGWWQGQSLSSFTIVHRRMGVVWAPQLLADSSRAAHLPQCQF